MGIFGALTTSVAGLRANSYALENISGNIANSQTTAFKRVDTSFLDLMPQAGTNQQVAGSVTVGIAAAPTRCPGSVQSASVSTYMAINGDGFFAVQKPGSFTDNNPVFTGVNNYTRRGDFSLDKNGYLVNGAGYYLQGVPIDPTTGNPVGSTPQVLKFQNDFLPSQATTKISYRANLASYPLTTKHDTSVPGSELLRAADFATNPQVAGTAPPPFGDNTKVGLQINSKAGTAITGATLLKGAAATNSASADFTIGDTITVGSKRLRQDDHLHDSGSGGRPARRRTPPISTSPRRRSPTCSATIDTRRTATSTTPSSRRPAAAITLHTGIATDLTLTFDLRRLRVARPDQPGHRDPHRRRHRRHRQVTGSRQPDLPRRIDLRRRHHRL